MQFISRKPTKDVYLCRLQTHKKSSLKFYKKKILRPPDTQHIYCNHSNKDFLSDWIKHFGVFLFVMFYFHQAFSKWTLKMSNQEIWNNQIKWLLESLIYFSFYFMTELFSDYKPQEYIILIDRG